jgi:hypothetical protein
LFQRDESFIAGDGETQDEARRGGKGRGGRGWQAIIKTEE